MQQLNKVFLVILLLGAIVVSGQDFSKYSIDNGLSQSVIHCIKQDNDGYVWIGTQDGINRFNGYSFEVFLNNSEDSNSLTNNWIYDFDFDNNGNIWVATRGGINCINLRNQKIKHFTIDNNEVEKNEINSVLVDRKNRVWVSILPKLGLYDSESGHFQWFDSGLKSTGAANDLGLPLYEDSDGNLWMSGQSGFACFDPQNMQFITSVDNSSIAIKGFAEFPQGKIWAATTDGLLLLSKDGNFNKKTLIDNKTRQTVQNLQVLLPDRNGNLWVGTNNQGLGKIVDFKALLLDYEPLIELELMKNSDENKESLSNDYVLSLCIDNSNNLWAGTLNGLNKADLKPAKFRLYRKSQVSTSVNLLDNVMAALYKSTSNEIWAGNWGKGLNIINPKNGIVDHYTETGTHRIVNNFVHVIFEDSKHNKWIGTRNGLQIFDSVRREFIRPDKYFGVSEKFSLQGRRVFKIIEEKAGIFWIATDNGVYLYNLSSNSLDHYVSENQVNSISNNLVYDLAKDSDGNIWIGTSNGLNKYTAKTKKFSIELENNPLFSDRYVVSLCVDAFGNIWIGTKSGVLVYNPENNIVSTPGDKAVSIKSTVYEIIEDKEQNIWIGTGKGLFRFNSNSKVLQMYSVDDGLQSMEFNLGTGYVAHDGEVFIGGMNGFNCFYPSELAENPNVPKIVFTSFELSTKEGSSKQNIFSGDTIIISPGVFAFNIEFAALEYTNPQKNSYKFKMKGLSEEWIDLGNRHFVPFTKIPAGKYVFSVAGANNDGVWNSESADLILIVKPPLWKTPGMLILYVVLTVLLIWGFIKNRERHLRQEKEILENKVKERTKQVVAQKEEIEKSHREIKQSINYAYRIQEAILPRTERLEMAFPDSFILFKPKDVVSGDFYWYKRFDDVFVIAAADCTGHGVPGAFMSMLGTSFLNEIIIRDSIFQANLILNELRNRVKETLKQEGKMGENKDGMDIALCVIDLKERKIQFAGANNHVNIISKGQLTTYKGDKMPIGVFIKEKSSFTNIEFSYQLGDALYLYSDGFPDQFGGTDAHKYGMRKLNTQLTSICEDPMIAQKLNLETSMNEWMNGQKQIDDMMVIGLRLW